MKSVTLLFPSAKARLRGPLQPKPSFQPASSFRESKHTAPCRLRPLLPRNIAPAEKGWRGASPAGAGLPGSTRAPSPGTAKHPPAGSARLDCKCRGKAQKAAKEGQRGKRHNLINPKKFHVSAAYPTIASLRERLRKVSLYKSRDVRAH